MTLWKNEATANGAYKPLYANTNADRGLKYAANNVYAVKTGEKANTQGQGPNVAHSGWVYFDLGRGGVVGALISGAGTGINSNGFLTIAGGGGTGANVAFYIGNAQTAPAIGFSTDASRNVIVQLAVQANGSGYNGAAFSVRHDGYSAISNATFALVLGGRGGRPVSEVLVAMSTITGDVSTGNIHFPGVL